MGEELTGGDNDVRILHVGSKNCSIAETLYDAGYLNITSIDTSTTIIRQRLNKSKERPLMTWREMDATALDNFTEESFDAVIDRELFDSLANQQKGLLKI